MTIPDAFAIAFAGAIVLFFVLLILRVAWNRLQDYATHHIEQMTIRAIADNRWTTPITLDEEYRTLVTGSHDQ